MKKHTLLGAVALTTIAVAGHAGAASLSAGNVTGATVTANVVVANDVTLTATTAAGKVGLILAPSTGAILPTGNAILSVEIKGGATFGEVVTAAAVVANGDCAPTTTISTGGGKDDKAVSFLVSNLGKCTLATPVHILLPVTLDKSNTAVNVEAGLKTELGTAIDGGVVSTYESKTATNLIGFKNAITVTTTADTVGTYATLASKFKGLSSDVALGTFKVEVAAQPKGIDDVTKITAAGDVTKAVLTLKGDFSTVDLSVGATKFAEATAGSGTATAEIGTAVAATHNITVATKAATPIIKASHYNLSAQLTAAGYKAANLEIASAPIQSITREGAAYLLPWVASETLAAASGSVTVVRLANIGTEATGPVSIELLTSSKGVPASTSLVQVAESIAKGGELVLPSGALQAALGADFGRGDIRITVEGQPDALVVRRLIQAANGSLSEVSLGRDINGNEPRN